MQTTFIIFQSILLVMYLIQDTVNMAPLNNLPAQIKHLGWKKTIIATVITSGLLALSLCATIEHPAPPLPLWLKIFFVLWWGTQMLGMYVAWYKPYIFGPTEKELAQYQVLFAGTHSVLPVRKGFPGPNTWHVGQNFFMVACAALAFLRVAGVF
jgi:hypothetical protein